MQCLVLAPKKLRDWMNSLLYLSKDFGILSRWIFFYCSINSTLDPWIFVALTMFWLPLYQKKNVLLWLMNSGQLVSSMPYSRSYLKFLLISCAPKSIFLWIKYNRLSLRVNTFLIVLLVHKKLLWPHIILIWRRYFLNLTLKGL